MLLKLKIIRRKKIKRKLKNLIMILRIHMILKLTNLIRSMTKPKKIPKILMNLRNPKKSARSKSRRVKFKKMMTIRSNSKLSLQILREKTDLMTKFKI
jgi:hypothetical protein